MAEWVKEDSDLNITIPCHPIQLQGILHLPANTKGIIVFAHGSGSGRLSPRNQQIAKQLQQIQFATLLFDLLTIEEDEVDLMTMQYRFDIPLLANRLISVTQWIVNHPKLHSLPIGYFGASTGGGAALLAAAHMQKEVKAVISRGGRPDLAGEEALPKVKAATLLIVGGEDFQVIELNKQAYALLTCVKKIEIVPGATHLFEEPGKLDEVSRLTKNWFNQYLQI